MWACIYAFMATVSLTLSHRIAILLHTHTHNYVCVCIYEYVCACFFCFFFACVCVCIRVCAIVKPDSGKTIRKVFGYLNILWDTLKIVDSYNKVFITIKILSEVHSIRYISYFWGVF